MRRSWRIGWAAVACAAALACGAGGSSVLGIGNSGNRFGWDLPEELADALAAQPGTPEIDDATLAEVFDAILARARSGDAESALIVLRVAERQRAPDES